MSPNSLPFPVFLSSPSSSRRRSREPELTFGVVVGKLGDPKQQVPRNAAEDQGRRSPELKHLAGRDEGGMRPSTLRARDKREDGQVVS